MEVFYYYFFFFPLEVSIILSSTVVEAKFKRCVARDRFMIISLELPMYL